MPVVEHDALEAALRAYISAEMRIEADGEGRYTVHNGETRIAISIRQSYVVLDRVVRDDTAPRGFAAPLMRVLTSVADTLNVPLWLAIKSDHEAGTTFLTADQLASWYGRNGFRLIGGGPFMIRRPQDRSARG